MDWITFSSNLIDSIAWPLAIVIVVYWLKGHIKELLPFVRKVRYGNVEVDFAEITERKTDEVLEEKIKEWGIYTKEILERQNIPEVKITTLRDEISELVSDAVQETRQVEKDVKIEEIRKRIIGLVKVNPSITMKLLENVTTDLFDFPRPKVLNQIRQLWGEGKIISSDGRLLKDISFLTLPAD